MSELFYFFNLSTGAMSKAPCRFNFGLPFMPDLETLDEVAMSNVFTQLVKDNDWDREDTVIAKGSQGTRLVWKSGVIQKVVSDESTYYPNLAPDMLNRTAVYLL
jgi:hypothetical protein